MADARLDLDVAAIRSHEITFLRDVAEIRQAANCAFRAVPGLRG